MKRKSLFSVIFVFIFLLFSSMSLEAKEKNKNPYPFQPKSMTQAQKKARKTGQPNSNKSNFSKWHQTHAYYKVHANMARYGVPFKFMVIKNKKR